MRWSIPIVALTLASCAAQAPHPDSAARRHAANVAAAEAADYRVTVRDGVTLFCATRAPTGSHNIPACMTEAEWERQQLWIFREPWCPAAAESCSQNSHSFVWKSSGPP
jgi:hypothetical protein